MVRTQIYMTEKQRKGLAALSRSTGKKQSELIREAVDMLVERSDRKQLDEALRRSAGLWKDRKDLPDFRALRREWDRR